MVSMTDSRRVVVKIGSKLLVAPSNGELKVSWLRTLCEDITAFKGEGKDVIIVSSGAIALGRRALSLHKEKLSLDQSQAAAAIGQVRLARAYEEAFAAHNLVTAQILVTLDDCHDRLRYLNTRSTMQNLLRHNVIPIVNENDSIATDEIRYGDNDRLAAQIAVTIGADQLILLSDVDGLYSADPATDQSAQRLNQIDCITQEIEEMAGDAGSGLSKGGMKTKILAAKTAIAAGCSMAIAPGMPNYPLRNLMAGGPATWFAPQVDVQAARKRWISSMKPTGNIMIDLGAVAALKSGKSLLPAGVENVAGAFDRGDPVTISDNNGRIIGQGLSRYSASETEAIKGRRSYEVESILGYPNRSALIHRDDMAL
ncbi:MAG: glutamate 5-kinase [Aestuariivita sp.]|nr:glutamate 5-kinase [Aestuariivita sp.]MCY4201619.1 glutamate 5-kinase [Aestuariivita sp.]